MRWDPRQETFEGHDEANRLLIAFSDAAKQLIGRRTLLESHMFPVTTYVATGLYNLHEIGYEALREVTESAPPEEIGRLGRRFLSRINQKTHFSIILGYLVGREQRLMDEDEYSTLGEDDAERYDPKGRAGMAMPGQPAIFIE